jgi:type II secretory pathway component PulK
VRNNRGSVLVTVIWALSLLAVYTVAVNRQVSQDLMFGQWMRDRVQGRALAKAAIERGLLELQSDKFITFEALNEPWASSAALHDAALGDGTFSLECKYGETVVYGACDEAARINVNRVPEDMLKNLLKAVDSDISDSKAGEIAQAIIDWRDQDDEVMANGAESSYYKGLSTPYLARNGPFRSVEELTMVKGMTPELYEKIKEHVTVYSEGKLNFNTAGTVALRALGLSESLINKVVKFRNGDDKLPGTKDDGIFQDASAITPELSAAMSFSSEEFAQISNSIAAGLVDVKSGVFRMQAVGRLNRGGRNSDTRIICVVQRSGDILYWNETSF